MRTRVRPIFVLLLCGVLLLGHIPAWLHAAVCHAADCSSTAAVSSESDQDSENQPSGQCNHCHSSCHSSDDIERSPGSAKESIKPLAFDIDQRHGGTHDEEHCVVCQSLAGAACGLIAVQSPLTEVDCSHIVIALPVGFWHSDQHHIQQPRGPPGCI
jgi:hypothetical protein